MVVVAKASVDKAKCIGCGLCVSLCSAVFDMGEDGKAYIKNSADCSKEKCCEEAAKSCPVQAINTGAKPQAKKK
jgi:ferredoxin